jgi:hypothetical protein
MSNSELEVGYMKPPKASRFKPGISGNPKGRPRGTRNLATICHEACHTTIRVKDGDGYRNVTKIQAAVTQLINKAAAGDLHAIKLLMLVYQASGAASLEEREKAVQMIVEFV